MHAAVPGTDIATQSTKRAWNQKQRGQVSILFSIFTSVCFMQINSCLLRKNKKKDNNLHTNKEMIVKCSTFFLKNTALIESK